MSCGAAMIGGTIHVKGDAGPRCGVAMKGGNIVVEGKIGYQSGFMAHSGKIIALGGAGASCADALWEGEVWVAGEVESLGVDVHVIEPTAEEVAEVDAILEPLGLVDSNEIGGKMISGQRLWYFESEGCKRMADDLNKGYEYPFELPSEEEIRFADAGAVGRPAGVPSSYDEGGSTRWTPEAISEVHALAQLGRYQVRGYNTFNKRLPTLMTLPSCQRQ